MSGPEDADLRLRLAQRRGGRCARQRDDRPRRRTAHRPRRAAQAGSLRRLAARPSQQPTEEPSARRPEQRYARSTDTVVTWSPTRHTASACSRCERSRRVATPGARRARGWRAGRDSAASRRRRTGVVRGVRRSAHDVAFGRVDNVLLRCTTCGHLRRDLADCPAAAPVSDVRRRPRPGAARLRLTYRRLRRRRRRRTGSSRSASAPVHCCRRFLADGATVAGADPVTSVGRGPGGGERAGDVPPAAR